MRLVEVGNVTVGVEVPRLDVPVSLLGLPGIRLASLEEDLADSGMSL